VSPERLERQQIWVYAAALLLGAALGFALPALGSALEVLIYPVLGVVLLYVTFLQVPFRKLRRSFTHGRYMAAVLALNFLIVPLVVWVLARLAPQDYYLLRDAVPRITIQLTNICRAAPVTRLPLEG
jgi:arsenite transporter